MKRYLLLCFLILSSMTLQALPVGNPWEASLFKDGVYCEGYCDPCGSWCDAWSFRVGYYGDFVDNRHLGIDETHDNIRQTEIWTNAGYLAFNLCNQFDLFATLGVSKFLLSTPENLFNVSGDDDIVDLGTETDFSWSIGARGTLWQCGCWALGAEGQYFEARPNLNYFHEYDQDPIYLSDETFKYKEWQIGLGLSYLIDICPISVVPYAAIKWAHAQVKLEGLEGDLRDLDSRRDFGYAIGMTLVGCQKFGLTLEKRFVDERAFYINAQVRF